MEERMDHLQFAIQLNTITSSQFGSLKNHKKRHVNSSADVPVLSRQINSTLRKNETLPGKFKCCAFRVGVCLTNIPKASPGGLTYRIASLNCDFFIKTIIYH